MGPWKPDSTLNLASVRWVALTLHNLPVSERDRFASELLRQNFFRICASWRPAVLKFGHPVEVVDEWVAKAQNEIVTMNVRTSVGVSERLASSFWKCD